jgi:pyruvate formate lyase activating enzyme
MKGVPYVFRIRRFAMDDGPGLRTTVFFKGCPLSCSWCHNPEGIAPEPAIAYDGTRCIQCGECVKACASGPLSGKGQCNLCGNCVRACPSAAREMRGVQYSIKELSGLILRDRHFFECSGGGVTLSGGEPTMAMEYVGELAHAMKREGIHVAIQTCGYFDWKLFEKHLKPHLDMVFCDLKLINPNDHVQHTGVDNRIILDNLRRMIDAGMNVVARTPRVPGITDTAENLDGIRLFLSSTHCNTHVLLPFNQTGSYGA